MPLATHPPDRANLYPAQALVYLDTVALEERGMRIGIMLFLPRRQAKFGKSEIESRTKPGIAGSPDAM